MNIGVYVNDFSNTEQMEGIAQELNNGLATKKIIDASLFYDGVCHNPVKFNFGLFNSTDIWNFDGYLVVTNINSLVNALNIVNKINIFYYYGWENQLKALDILYAISRGVKILCRSEEDAVYIRRITGQYPVGISKNFDNIIDILKGQQNG